MVEDEFLEYIQNCEGVKELSAGKAEDSTYQQMKGGKLLPWRLALKLRKWMSSLP
jgi:hypothetical protein